MGEVKRIFNQAKIDRDIDARMLPPGAHRDALNVSIGESEGGDVGAVENLKGNEEIAAQNSLAGTTIGSIRDPSSNKIYWFNTSPVFDAIYEYDQSANTVTTILREPKARTAALPTCSPKLQARITDPQSIIPIRPQVIPTPPPPLGGCTTPGQQNYDPLAEYDNGTCTPFPPASYTKTLAIQNNVSGFANGYLSGDLANATRSGTSGQSWSFTTNVVPNSGYQYSGNSPFTISGTFSSTSVVTSTITGSIDPIPPGNCTSYLTTVNGVTGGAINASYFTLTGASSSTATCTSSLDPFSVFPVSYTLTQAGIDAGYSYAFAASTYTGNGGTYGSSPNIEGTARGTVTFSAPTYTLNASSSGSVGSNITVNGEGITNQIGTQNVTEGVSFTATLSITSGYEWVSPPSVSVTGLPPGVSESSISGGNNGSTGDASITVSGQWMPTDNVIINVVWSGGSVQPIPQACNAYFIQYSGTNLAVYYTNCSTGVESLYNLSDAATSDEITSLTTPYRAPGGSGNIFSITQQ